MVVVNESGMVPSYSSVGGYGLVYLGVFNDILCPECVNAWTVEGIRENVTDCFIHWEGQAVECDGCGCQLESEYGEDE